MSIVDHPEFKVFSKAMLVEPYARDWAKGRPTPRVRIWAVPTDGVTLEQLLSVRMACVNCGRGIDCFRQSRGKKLHFSPTCRQDVTLVCSRQTVARDEYVRVTAALGGAPMHKPKKDDAVAAMRAAIQMCHEAGLNVLSTFKQLYSDSEI